MKKNPNKIENLERLSEISSKYWMPISIAVAISSFWSLILTYLGESIGLVSFKIDNNQVVSKALSPIAWIITVVLIVSVIFNIVTSRYKETHDKDKRNALTYKYWHLLLDKILSSLDGVCKNKLNTQINTIINLKDTKSEPPIIYSDPSNQLKSITFELKNCIAYLLSDKGRKFKSEDIYVSIAYNFPQEDPNDWQWAEQLADEKGISIKDLQHRNTTFTYVWENATEKSPYVFYNSKQKAYEEGHYVCDDDDLYDSNHKLKGSIACFRIIVKKKDIQYIKAVLSISSYENQFVDISAFATEEEQKLEIENTSGNMYRVPIAEFSERIKIELCNSYIKLLRDKWEEQKLSEK